MSKLTQRKKTDGKSDIKAQHKLTNTKIRSDDKEFGDSEKYLILSLICLRIINTFLVRTSFVPDEYWQSLEVAYKSVFGYGYLTWEWKYGLRSYIYPAIFSGIYQILNSLGIDNPVTLIYGPRLFQAFLSAIGDVYLYKFVKLYFGYEIANYGILCNCINWFWWYCSTRTIINTFETNLLCIGLYYYPWNTAHWYLSKVAIYQLIAILITVIRPTAAVIWVPLALWHIFRSRNAMVFLSYVVQSFFVLITSTLIDLFYYGKFVFVPWNFFKFNVMEDMGVHYGTHPWHWYITQGIPAILTTQMIFFIFGAAFVMKHTFPAKLSTENLKICKCLLSLFLFTVLVYSFLGHKEFRFVLHLVPIASLFSGISLSTFSKKMRNTSLIFLLITNVPVALYTGLIHQRGPLEITDKLKDLLAENCISNCPGSVLYLMPCHTTPLYSHLHLNVTTRFLTCPPNLSGIKNYSDEADQFHSNPIEWLDNNIFSQKILADRPYWILLFDSLYDKLKAYDPLDNYNICATAFHTHVPEGRTGRFLYILCKKTSR
ncbi:GPI alpha-1,2-mannosyltransferase 3-like [Styela clava]